MKKKDDRALLIELWLGKADNALAAARHALQTDDLSLAMNRIYYACFYAVTGVLLSKGLSFNRHAAVRSAVHQHLIKPGLIDVDRGAFYDRAFDDRQEADYDVTAEFELEIVAERIDKAAGFVHLMRDLLAREVP